MQQRGRHGQLANPERQDIHALLLLHRDAAVLQLPQLWVFSRNLLVNAHSDRQGAQVHERPLGDLVGKGGQCLLIGSTKRLAGFKQHIDPSASIRVRQKIKSVGRVTLKQSGKHHTITLRGEAVADLLPAQGHKGSDAATAAENMRAFMRSRQPVAGVNLKALIAEGRT